jgi:hypothetical protein
VESAGEFRVLAESVAVPADVHDVTVMDEAVDQRRRHDVIAEDLAPLFEAFITREDRGGVFVAPGEELEEEHRSGTRDREIADLVDDHQTGKDQRAETVGEAAAALCFFEGVEQIGERREVLAAPVLRCGDGETQGEMRLADTRWSKENDILLALEKAERM